MFFFHSRIPFTFSHLTGDSVSDLPCFESFQECWSDTHLLHLVLSHVVILTLWSLVLGEDHSGKMPSSSHHTKGTYDQHDLPLLLMTWGTWLDIEYQVKGDISAREEGNAKKMLFLSTFFQITTQESLHAVCSYVRGLAPFLESGTEWEYLNFHLLFLNWFEKPHYFSHYCNGFTRNTKIDS